MDSLLETILQQVQQSRQIKKELKDTVAQEFSTGNRVKVLNILERLLNELKTKSMMGETQKHIESAIKTFSMDLKQSKRKKLRYLVKWILYWKKYFSKSNKVAK